MLVAKWGLDGASNQQTTRQKWNQKSNNLNETMNVSKSSQDEKQTTDDENNVLSSKNSKNNIDKTKNKSDSSVLLVSMVPLELREDKNIIWTNETPSSVHYCRAIEFQFVKETCSIIKKIYKKYTELLEKVQFYDIYVKGMFFTVSFDIKCTMIDGKICNF